MSTTCVRYRGSHTVRPHRAARTRLREDPGVSSYSTIVVGTDGSETSLRAVARAGAIAGATGATLVIACAYLPDDGDSRESSRAGDVLRDEAYQIVGSHPAEDKVRTAADKARAEGAK